MTNISDFAVTVETEEHIAAKKYNTLRVQRIDTQVSTLSNKV